MAIPLDPTLKMNLQLLASRANSIWSWWSDEMLSMLPAALRRYWTSNRPRLAIDLTDGRVTLYPADANAAGRMLGHLSLEAGFEDVQAALDAMLDGFPKDNLGLAISMPGVLSREIELPIAAAGDLDEVLRLDMDRQMPFEADDVLFTHRLIARHPDRGVITVALTVAPKSICALPRTLATTIGLPLDYLGASTAPPWSDNIHEPAPSGKSQLVMRGLWGCTAVLAALALWLPLERDRLAAEAMAARLAEAKAQQASLAAEREALSGFLAAADSIRRQNSADALPILSDITSSLPLDGWLERLDWQADEVEIAGHVRATAEFAANLGSLERFEAIDYLTPVTRDENGLERFNLALRLSPEPSFSSQPTALP